MSSGASVLDGQLTRTWKYPVNGKLHLINLFHDTITGVRSVMVDFEEVPGSMGNSSLVMESTGHKIPFSLPGDNYGYIGIQRSGFFGFEYSCFVLDLQIKEVTDDLKNVDGTTYETGVVDTINTPPVDDSGQGVVFYVVKVKRISDGSTTTVHRRFRDFADMNSQIKQNLKGHQIWSSLPALPDKTLKFLVDHNDPGFIQERKEALHTFLAMMVNLPHVNEMTCVKGFLGLMDSVTEYSIVFYTPQLGLSIDPGSTVPVSSIQNASLCPGVQVGDCVSKLAGQPVSNTSFTAMVNYLKTYPRPLIVHFIRTKQSQTQAQAQTQQQSSKTINSDAVGAGVAKGASGKNVTGSGSGSGSSGNSAATDSPASSTTSSKFGGGGSGSGTPTGVGSGEAPRKGPSSAMAAASAVSPVLAVVPDAFADSLSPAPLILSPPKGAAGVTTPSVSARTNGAAASHASPSETLEDQSI